MAKTDKHKFQNYQTYNGDPPKEGEVIAPFWITQDTRRNMLQAGYRSFYTWKFCGRSILLCFAPIGEEHFDGYMEFFWSEINSHIRRFRSGRCILGYQENGLPKICPKTNRCRKCEHRNEYPRQDMSQSLPEEFSASDLTKAEEYDLWKSTRMGTEETAMLDDALEDLIRHLAEIKPRYAQMLGMDAYGYAPQEIFEAVGLKPSRGYQELARVKELVKEYWDPRNNT